jgi:hypothetical protein
MFKRQILKLGSTAALACSLLIACGNKGDSAQSVVGVRIASITNNSTNTAFGNQNSNMLTVSVADDTGSNSFTISLSSSVISGDLKQIGSTIYELQSRCVNTQCTDVAFMILSRNGYLNPNSSFNSNFSGNQNSFSGSNVSYQPNVTSQYVVTTDVTSSREFLYRATGLSAGSTTWALVRSLEDKTGRIKLLDDTQLNALEQGI